MFWKKPKPDKWEVFNIVRGMMLATPHNQSWFDEYLVWLGSFVDGKDYRQITAPSPYIALRGKIWAWTRRSNIHHELRLVLDKAVYFYDPAYSRNDFVYSDEIKRLAEAYKIILEEERA